MIHGNRTRSESCVNSKCRIYCVIRNVRLFISLRAAMLVKQNIVFIGVHPYVCVCPVTEKRSPLIRQ